MNKRKKTNIGVIFLVIIFAYLSWVAIGQQKQLFSKNVELDKLNQKISEEQKANDELKQEKETMGTDAYKEKVAREKLGMVKPDERVYVDIGK